MSEARVEHPRVAHGVVRVPEPLHSDALLKELDVLHEAALAALVAWLTHLDAEHEEYKERLDIAAKIQ